MPAYSKPDTGHTNKKLMKNYRIKKVEDGFLVLYYPQKKILGLFWWDMFSWDHHYQGGFGSYARAKEALCRAVRGPSVEYFDVDCGG